MNYRPWLEGDPLRQMGGLPHDAFDVLARTMARICEDPYDRLFSLAVRDEDPRERMAELGDAGFIQFTVDESAGLVRVYDLVLDRLTAPAVVTAVDELLDHHTHAQIAGILNDRGLTSGEGRPFHRLIIRNIRDEYGLRSREQRLRDAGMLTLTQMAGRLGVPAKTVKTWYHAGLITGHPYNDKGQCLYPPPGPNPPARAQGRKLSERRPARPATPADHATTREPAGNVGPHRYCLHHDKNTTARIDSTRCSMQPEVWSAGSGRGSGRGAAAAHRRRTQIGRSRRESTSRCRGRRRSERGRRR